MRPWEIHPALVHFPIALLVAAALAQVWSVRGGQGSLRQLASTLALWGAAVGWVAAIAGLFAFVTLPGHSEAVHALMLVHAGLATAGLVAFSANIAVARMRPARGAPTWVMFVGAALVIAAAFLGGRMVYREGAGVFPGSVVSQPHDGHHHSHDQ